MQQNQAELSTCLTNFSFMYHCRGRPEVEVTDTSVSPAVSPLFLVAVHVAL